MKIGKYDLKKIPGTTVSGKLHQAYFYDSPNGSYAYASHAGKKYFIKKLKNPTYPHNKSAFTNKIRDSLLKKCKEFETKQNKLLMSVSSMTFDGCNVVTPVDFFRIDSSYYKITPLVEEKALTINEIRGLSASNKNDIFISLTKSLQTLHSLKIVHGDLKPENILVVKQGDKYVAKIIDFDDSYFEGDVHEPDDIVGTASYYSPELALYVENLQEGDEVDPRSITCKNDIFALGIIFHQYLTGEFPNQSESKRGIYNIVLKDELKLSESVPIGYRNLIISMLSAEKENRPTIQNVTLMLKEIKGDKTIKKDSLELTEKFSGTIKKTVEATKKIIKHEEHVKPIIRTKHSTTTVKSKAESAPIKPKIVIKKTDIVKTSSVDAKVMYSRDSRYKYQGKSYDTLEEMMRAKMSC